ncbi:thiamine pyrophosphate-binding protein [Micromonospora sp. WMMA1363]|uniref:thiamine pyrophosphate-binding protein n=1 Tax=Micromonospora sp. WMMA1363 TaxID=3053985 RepID=UPI00259CE661|nr:thiamine pyrophosphate-binding protein [Micromonospora sp. WMMA1363]MDM4719365.1 thiamine pyrophosphate-binding protein [Micromonospora sp. WMMA1363]
MDRIAAALARTGVRHVFGVSGANIEDLYEALRGTDGATCGVVAKHEFSAATMADGAARVTGRLGVVAATSGGGAMNLVPGLAEAYASRVPMLALVGQPPTAQEGRGAFQDSSGLAGSFDARAVFEPVSWFCARVDDPASIDVALAEAISAACQEPKGPAVLLLPKDVQQALVEAPSAGVATVPVPATEAPSSTLDQATALLREARQVLVIAGEGVASSGAQRELGRLVGRLGAWVAVTPDARDAFDNRHPAFAGVAGVMGHDTVAELLRRADVCLLAGTRLPVLARGGLEEALAGTPVICVDPEPPYIPGLALTGSPRPTLRALSLRLGPHRRPRPPHHGPALLSGTRSSGETLAEYADALHVISSVLPPDVHVFVDAGNAGAAAIHLLSPAPRGRFVVATGMGGMGYTFGAGIGAALATGRRTYVLAGDGAFYAHGTEVHTALETTAPVTFVIFNNNAHAMCVTREDLYQDGASGINTFRPSNIAAGASAMFPGLPATHATSAPQLRAALLAGQAGGGPALVAMDFDPAELPPFRPFLAAGQAPVDNQEREHDDRAVHVG